MPKKSQFQNLALQQELRDYTEQPTIVQPAITLPIKPETLHPLPPARSLLLQDLATSPGASLAVQTNGGADLFPPEEPGAPVPLEEALSPSAPRPLPRKKMLLRCAALLLTALLVLAIYLTWHSATPTAASPMLTQQTYSSAATSSSVNDSATTTPSISNGATIQVYIVGAVKHPGVYTLPANARVYQLIQAAGGTLPSANLVAIDLAARLSDGQEIYVLSVGETPPILTNNSSGTSASGTPTLAPGQLVNINTATETAMEQELHVSSTTAKKIIDYRTQHGPYTSVDQLLQVVSQSIYDRIKGLVTV